MIKEILSYRYLPGDIKVPYLILFVTSRCNFRCPQCFYRDNLSQGKNDLSSQELQKISRSVGRLLWLSLSGGEPFLREDLAEIAIGFYQQTHFQRFFIPTNGFLTDTIIRATEEMLKRISCPFSVAVSIDEIGAEHDRLKGREHSFERLRETTLRLKELKRKHPHFSVKANTVVSSQNHKRIKEIGDYVLKELALDYHTFELARDLPPDAPIQCPGYDDCVKVYRQVRQIWRKYQKYERTSGRLGNFLAKGLYKYLHNIHLKSLSSHTQAIPCLAGKTSGVIYEDGRLALCELLPPLGNLREVGYDFDRLWYTEKADRMREDIRNAHCHCTHTCFQFTSALFNPREYPKIVAAGIETE